MTHLKTRIVASAATVALLATSFAPATFAKVKVNKNGADSTNKVKIKSNHKTKVNQTNSTAVVNLVGVFQNTGMNQANKNTGDGQVSVDSGDATSTVTNRTTTGGNAATVDPCACENPDMDVTVKKNGADSTNTVKITSKNKTVVNQTNETLVINGVLVAQNTGGNSANSNTGDGGVDVDSGDADSTVTNTVTTGGNTLNP